MNVQQSNGKELTGRRCNSYARHSFSLPTHSPIFFSNTATFYYGVWEISMPQKAKGNMVLKYAGRHVTTGKNLNRGILL